MLMARRRRQAEGKPGKARSERRAGEHEVEEGGAYVSISLADGQDGPSFWSGGEGGDVALDWSHTVQDHALWARGGAS